MNKKNLALLIIPIIIVSVVAVSLVFLFRPQGGNICIKGPGFISVWDTRNLGTSGSNQVKLPLESSGTYSFTVYWGDGTNNTITSWNQDNITHTYALEGVYSINITGTIVGWCFNNGGDRLKLLEIKRWGDLRLGNSGGYFWGCINLYITACDSLNLNGTTNLAHAFQDCSYVNQYISSWDVSSVTDMSYMFYDLEGFNQNISSWDVSSVTDMSYMFSDAITFNQDISSWDVSSVTDMSNMFQGVTLSTANYDNLLIGWNSLPTLQTGVTFHAGNSKYSSAAAAARQSLVDPPNSWSITDGGPI